MLVVRREAGLRGGGVVGGHRGGRGEERSGPYPSGQLLEQSMTRPLGRPGSLLQDVLLRVDIGSGTFPCIGPYFFEDLRRLTPVETYGKFGIL